MSRKFYKNIEDELTNLGFQIVDSNLEKPWGAYFCIDENQAQDFSNKFFDGIHVDSLKIENKLSPKILIVKPNTRLSWQYHNRRAEIWQHTDEIPSNENDIIMVQDDFNR